MLVVLGFPEREVPSLEQRDSQGRKITFTDAVQVDLPIQVDPRLQSQAGAHVPPLFEGKVDDDSRRADPRLMLQIAKEIVEERSRPWRFGVCGRSQLERHGEDALGAKPEIYPGKADQAACQKPGADQQCQ